MVLVEMKKRTEGLLPTLGKLEKSKGVVLNYYGEFDCQKTNQNVD